MKTRKIIVFLLRKLKNCTKYRLLKFIELIEIRGPLRLLGFCVAGFRGVNGDVIPRPDIIPRYFLFPREIEEILSRHTWTHSPHPSASQPARLLRVSFSEPGLAAKAFLFHRVFLVQAWSAALLQLVGLLLDMLRLPSCLGVAGLGSPSLHFGLGCAGLGLVGWGRARVEGRGLGSLGRDWAGCAPHRRLAYVVRVGFAPSGLSSGSGWAAFARAKRV